MRPLPKPPAQLTLPKSAPARPFAKPKECVSVHLRGRTALKHLAHSLHVMKDGTLPHFIPDRRERLLDALAQLGEPAGGKLATRLWGAVVIDGTKCVSCRMCATFCPTGAIASSTTPTAPWA